MFPDFKIAKKYGSVRTKTSVLAYYIAGDIKEEIVEQVTPFYSAADDKLRNLHKSRY